MPDTLPLYAVTTVLAMVLVGLYFVTGADSPRSCSVRLGEAEATEPSIDTTAGSERADLIGSVRAISPRSVVVVSERIRAYPGREASVLLEDERRELCEFGRRIVECGLVVGASGNLSVRRGPLVAITPSGAPLERITPAECAVVDLKGTVVEGTRTPSSETPMHLALYESDPHAGAVVHTHAVFGAVVATTLPVLPAIHYNVLLLGGHDVRVAPYATYGTPELADSVRAALAGGRSGALLANHGGVTLGRDLIEAYDRTKILEWLCEVYVRSLAVGTPSVLTAAELAAVERRMTGTG